MYIYNATKNPERMKKNACCRFMFHERVVNPQHHTLRNTARRSHEKISNTYNRRGGHHDHTARQSMATQGESKPCRIKKQGDVRQRRARHGNTRRSKGKRKRHKFISRHVTSRHVMRCHESHLLAFRLVGARAAAFLASIITTSWPSSQTR